ncbi:hypothetical protein VPH35_003905 [Triticum aestivum]
MSFWYLYVHTANHWPVVGCATGDDMTSVLLHINISILIFSSYGQPLARYYYSKVTEFILFHLISTVGLLVVIVQKPDCILMVNSVCLYPNLRCYGATQLYIA